MKLKFRKRKKTISVFDSEYELKRQYFPNPNIKCLTYPPVYPGQTKRQFFKEVKYRGPLSYRSIRMLGLLFMFLGIVVSLISVALEEVQGNEISPTVIGFFDILADIALPLFLIAAFSAILNSRKNMKSKLCTYAIGTISIFTLLVYIYEHYIIGLLSARNTELIPEEIREQARLIMLDFLNTGLNYNIFLDLLLCTTFFFFTNYIPKKLKGKKLTIFRWCALIPVIYLVLSITLSILQKYGITVLPIELYVLLICRAPAVYILFFALSLFLKNRQRIFLKKGGTPEEYQEYLNSNKNSLNFSLMCSISLAVISIVEYILSFFPWATAIGFGTNYNLFFAIPFVMLLSYTRDYQNKSIDILVYLFFLIGVILAFIETYFQVLISGG